MAVVIAIAVIRTVTVEILDCSDVRLVSDGELRVLGDVKFKPRCIF